VPELAVLIAAVGLQPALKSIIAAEAHEVITFSDTEALRALEAITARRPAIVALERGFADTPRGMALMNRIKADPALAGASIRVTGTGDAAASSATPATNAAQAPAGTPVVLDYRGTRRAPRFAIEGTMDIVVDGKRGTLVDLSKVGAQVITGAALRPNQRIRVSLADERGTLRFPATVVWATFEMPKGAGPQYRVGLDFVDAPGGALEEYINRHKREQT
jgi:hypothetical protein